MEQVAVYAFDLLDRATGNGVTAARKGTPDAIRRVKGIADLSSMELVDTTEVDVDGFYPTLPVAARCQSTSSSTAP
jgi:hypothetical protein